MRFWSVFVWLFVMCLMGHAAMYSLPSSLAGSPWWIAANVALVTITASAFATLLELRESRPTAEP